jgi:XTP/dITP diphosphohydrolase
VRRSDFAVRPGSRKPGLSFVENAILKARHASVCSGLPALADDSGLEVDALGGQPGVHSARYAGGSQRCCGNNRKLLEALATYPRRNAPRDFTACWRCCATPQTRCR